MEPTIVTYDDKAKTVTLPIDIDSTVKSQSGRSIRLASTFGFQNVVGLEGVKVNLNVIKNV